MHEILRIAVPTRNRPNLLARIVDSVLKDARKSGQYVELLVADQSDRPIEERNAVYLKHAAKIIHGDIFHLGSQAKRELAAIGPSEVSLLSAGAVRDDRHGENRNWISLFYAGYSYASFDDDVVVNGIWSKDLRGFEGCLQDSSMPWSFLAYPSDSDMYLSIENVPGHLSVAAEMLSSLSNDGMDSRDVFVVPGIAGHSGLASHILLVDTSCELSSRRMLMSDLAFTAAMRATSVVRQVTRRRTDVMKGFVATAFATRNSAPTLPFMTWGRGEDHVFCKALRASGRSPQVVSPQFCVLHLPEHSRVPSITIDVAGVASLATAAIESIGNCGSTDDFIEALLALTQRKDRHSVAITAVLEHAERQALFCSQVARAAAVCRTAFAAVEGQLLQWQGLSRECKVQSSHSLANRLSYAIELMHQLAMLGNSWQKLWAWFLSNQAIVRRASLIVRRL